MPSASRLTFLATSAALLAMLVVLAPDFGATWDEPQQRAKALRLIAHLEGRLPELSEPIDGAHLYGAPFDVVAAALEPVVPVDPYVIRHEVIAVVAWVGLVVCGLLADRLFGPPHGVGAMALLAISPFYMAHAANNPKDLPFATIATAMLLALVPVASGTGILSWPSVAAFAALIGLGLNVRPGALLFVGYLGVVVLHRLLRGRPVRVAVVAQAMSRIALVLAGAVAVGWVAWPWAYAHPIVAPFRAMAELGHFGWGGHILFDGVSYPGTALPWNYIPTWFWLTTPPVVMVGVALSIAALRSPAIRDPALGLWGAALFPVVYAAGTHATLYDGVRHLLFIVPPLVVLSTVGWIAALRRCRPPWRWLVLAVLAAGVAEPLWFQWRNHPNQVAYIQPLAGGARSAYARYDLDYWGNCLRAGLEAVDRRTHGQPTSITGWPMIVLQADVTRFPALTLVESTEAGAAYSVRLARGSRDELLALSADSRVIDRVTTADGALLCTVSATSATPPGPTSRP